MAGEGVQIPGKIAVRLARLLDTINGLPLLRVQLIQLTIQDITLVILELYALYLQFQLSI